MAISLYDLSVTAYLQTLGATSRILDKGLTHFREASVDPEEIVEVRLFADMLPFRFQIQSIVHHSVGAIAAIKKGAFQPSFEKTPHDYAALQELVKEAQKSLETENPEEINLREGADVTFQAGDTKLRFSAEDFVMSFSHPNFHFHATTAYDILRSKGVPLGKRDYMGRLRFKR
ncbi:MAG TPA: DUF1993 domain-containing protein [Polyangiales bacterium]|jgi:hypothetical protein|nr:DUF1993 domain-containing protein [Polyangiales bacterium]